jgi:hypothetical protein
MKMTRAEAQAFANNPGLPGIYQFHIRRNEETPIKFRKWDGISWHSRHTLSVSGSIQEALDSASAMHAPRDTSWVVEDLMGSYECAFYCYFNGSIPDKSEFIEPIQLDLFS